MQTSTLFDKDYSLWLKHPISYTSLSLPSHSIEPQIDQIFNIIFSLCYQTRYSLILELFFDDPSVINQITIDNLLRNLYNFATPLFPENPHFELIILTPQLTNNPSILSRPPSSTISVIFEHDSSSSHHNALQICCPVQPLTLIPHKFNAKDFYTKLEPYTTSKELKSYNRSCLGGTYDHFHAGHRLFLSFSALATKEYLLVGLTSDELLLKKTHKSAIQSYETRRNSVRKFFDYFDPNLQVVIPEIKDPAGPAKDGDFDVIIVTPETIKGGDYVNKLRREGGYKELEVVVGNLVSSTGEIQDKLSSTNLREVIMEKVGGKVEVLEGLYKEWEGLMKSLGVEDEKFVGVWFDRLKEKYCESWRYYHTLGHIWELLRLVNENIEKIEEKDVVKLTAWFHDVIYVPQRGDNEKESARFFGEFCDDLETRFPGKLAKEKKEKVEKIILFTINHTQIDKEAEDWFDAKFFLDIDLGILGADSESYKEYTKNIRKEYCFVSEETFCEKRSQFMKKFLNKELRIYKTDLFIEKLEAKALENVEQEVEQLENSLRSQKDVINTDL